MLVPACRWASVLASGATSTSLLLPAAATWRLSQRLSQRLALHRHAATHSSSPSAAARRCRPTPPYPPPGSDAAPAATPQAGRPARGHHELPRARAQVVRVQHAVQAPVVRPAVQRHRRVRARVRTGPGHAPFHPTLPP
jgi:hypothetical protein